ncbi:uncharacterized protein LOC118751741 [Rhagoletis pomonella]|uniref:uncharacterized protein LOC118751741 n=1 Tax=Rhagoletis pomonella TaxID=28610 RepID=UPI00177DE8A1|nr:uncharacterized protein LOC118751741 [Rhagoletis pomonella]
MEKFTSAEGLRELIEEELSIRLELLGELKHNFETVQSKLEEHHYEELEADWRPKFTEGYIRVKTVLTKEISSRHVPKMRHSSTIRHLAAEDQATSIIISQPKARLPPLQIPKFGGAYTEWPDFYSMFETMVGNDPELTKIEKFQHLRTSLKDSALDAIRSLEINDHNYDKAVGILQDRFNNKRLNFQAHIKELFGLKKCEKGAVDQLRELSDKFTANLRALQTIATKEQIADGILAHLIVNKFDVDSQMKWEETTPVKELPTLDSVMSFWNRRCQMLENVENATVTQTPSKQVGRKIKFQSS